MTDKEFKRLNRSQLIEIIYQLQLKQEELTADNKKLAKALADKRLRISRVGNIAEAALEIHNVMGAAQKAAEHYLEEVRLRGRWEQRQLLKEANDKAAEIIARAERKAAAIVAQARGQQRESLSGVMTVQRKYGRDE